MLLASLREADGYPDALADVYADEVYADDGVDRRTA